MIKRLSVKNHETIAKDTFALVLKGAPPHKPGQFINITVPGEHFLRRPFSIADQEGDEILVIYKVFGSGTQALSEVKIGETLDCLTCLGNGFGMTKHKHVYLIGGGVGIPPLYYLAKALKKHAIDVTMVLGFNTEADCFLIEAFETLGTVIVATLDGSRGIQGTVLEGLKDHTVNYYYAVGPNPMLKALTSIYKDGEVSLEERMGCGFGACMGCSIKTKHEPKRVCKEGPVFKVEELVWKT